MKINYSRLQTYFECPTRYYWKYKERLYDPFQDMHLANEGHRIQAILTKCWQEELAFTEEEKFLYEMFEDSGFKGDGGICPNDYVEYKNIMCHLDGFSINPPIVVWELKTVQDLLLGFHRHRISYQIPFYVKAIFEKYLFKEVFSKLLVIKMPRSGEDLSKKKVKAWYRVQEEVWTVDKVDTILKPFVKNIDILTQIENNEIKPEDLLKNYTQCKYCEFQKVCSDNDFFGLVQKPQVEEENDL